MNENQLVLSVIPRLLLIVTFVMCYILGGRSKKWVRRWLGGSLFGIGVLWLAIVSKTYSHFLLPIIALYPASLTLPYGSSVTWKKVFLRAIYGLAVGGVGLYVAIITQSFSLGIFHIAISISSSIWLGIVNPTEAVYEETLIATLLVLCVPFMV